MVLVLEALLPCFCTLFFLTLLPGVEPVVPLEDFYPFGRDKGDSQTIAQDDGGSGLLEISVAFPFFGDRHTGLYVNNNGLVSFLREVSQFTPVAFPIAGDRRVVAPFWADVDNRRAGTVFYRESQDPMILRKASGDVRTYFSEFPNFNATWVHISTWHQVTFFGGNSQTPLQVNTFQVVLITDGELSFTIFQYNNITWTTGMHASSGGNLVGLGGIAAQAGFNAGDGKRYFNIPGSRTADVVNVEGTTNVGFPGRWVFRIDDANVEVGSCNNSSVCPHLRPCLNGGQCIDDCIKGNPSFTCSCLAGFTGRRCQIVNECASQPCQNGGTCKDQINSFMCQCPPGYTGILCETIDECKDRPCLNNATCVRGAGAFTCVCEPGYTGVLCETIDECESQPCLNGGECIDRVNNFTCTCPAAFTGTLCETEAENQTSCEELDCKKNQICEYTILGIYNCTCVPGFYGDNCEECLCQNGGVCVDINGTCECPSGYTGLYCQFVTQMPCSNGRSCPDGNPCLEYGGAYLCTCQTRVELDHKDFYPYQPESVCDSSPCLNGGYCYELDGGYTCECKYGYWGKNCEKRLNTCASGPCRNGGSCKEEADSYRCVCPYRFTGKHCEVKPDPCASSPCLNGGTCFHYIGKYKCECTDAYSGRHCEINRSAVHTSALGCGSPPQVKHTEVQFSLTTLGSMPEYICHPGFTSVPIATQSISGIQEINECLSQPCLNGGTCRNKIGSYQCVCASGFSGNRCQIINECLSETCMNRGTCEDRPGSYQDMCESNPCLNGGVCRGYRRNYLCMCKDGFFGDQCQMEDPCVLKPCGNRGRCWSDRRGNYNCMCKVGLTGKDCEKLLPPPGLHVLRVEESEVELRWDEPEPSNNLISMFAVTYAPLGQSNSKTDYLDRQKSTHVMRGLMPGLLYNISTFSIKLKTNSSDTSQPATALIRTPQPAEQLQVVNVSSSQVWLQWLVQAARHAAVSRVHVSLLPSDGREGRTAVLNTSTTEYTFSLQPGQMYTVDVLTQSGIRPDEFPSMSHSAGPLSFWTPLPPQNLSLSHVTPNSALITWSRHPRHVSDGFVVNVTRGLNTRSRFLPNGRVGSYTLRELTPGQHYYVALTSVKNTGPEQIHSVPQHLAFTTYTELIDRRGKITAKFTHLPRKPIRHRTPEPPVRLEKMEETTNKISLALEIREEALRTKLLPQDCRSLPCQNGGTCVNGGDTFICDCAAGFKGRQCELCQRVPHPCTRLYSETKSVPVWEGGVCHYYKRTYKVQQDVCYREICEPTPSKKSQ
uniref:Sushi, nidogen and EGF-like domain-containing protein 1 n=1 Tax=Neolamprologus brichardi TaxID=32507 RepID=A0A3Q4H8C9_NEOBR